MGIIQLSPALAMPLHGVGAIALVWFLHRVCLTEHPTISQPRPDEKKCDVTPRLIELGIQPAGPDTRACINLAIAERRQDRREVGNDVPVYVFDEFGFCQGRVVNKSRGGLCIASECNVTVGQSIRIQSQSDSHSADSIDMKVRHVRKVGDEWIFGAEFLRKQDPAVLKLFGD